jgi:hypothetical protein
VSKVARAIGSERIFIGGLLAVHKSTRYAAFGR